VRAPCETFRLAGALAEEVGPSTAGGPLCPFGCAVVEACLVDYRVIGSNSGAMAGRFDVR
jgi:hypothetical protein